MITGREFAMPFVVNKEPLREIWHGLTIRQQFAAMAMQGLIAGMSEGRTYGFEYIADQAVRAADALIIELNKAE